MGSLFAAKGTIYAVPNSEGGNAYFNVVEIQDLFRKNNTGFVKIEDIRVSSSDILAKYTCLQDKKVVYLFGQNFGSIEIICTAYLGKDAASMNDTVIHDALDAKRISKFRTPLIAQAGAKMYKFLLTDFSIGSMNHEQFSRQITITGVIP